MAITAPDTNVIVRQYLIETGTELYSLIGTRVALLRKLPAWAATDACIVFSKRGGPADPDVPIARPNYQFLCFGGSNHVQDAEEVARALKDRLHGQNLEAVAAGVIISAEQDEEAQPMIDPDTEEVYVFVGYEMEIRGV